MAMAGGRTIVAGAALLAAIFTMPTIAEADMVGHGGMIRSIAVSADGQYALTASFDYSARLWRFDEQRELRSLDGHDGPVNGAIFSRHDKAIVTVGADGKVILWDRRKAGPTVVMNGHHGRTMSVVETPDGKEILTAGWDGRLILWNLAQGAKIKDYDTGVPIVSAALGLGSDMFVAGGRDGIVRLLRRADGVTIGRIRAHDIGLTQLAASGDGRRLVTIGLDNAARVWDLATLAAVSSYAPDPEVKPVSVVLSVDGSEMLIGYVDGNLVHLDTVSGRVKRRLKVEDGPVWAVAFTPDGRFALSAGISERVRVWHLESGDRISVGEDDDGDRHAPWLESDHPGARLFRKCANCHALTKDERQRAGPHFDGLFGRKAGGLAGYRYSKALREARVVWSRKTIAELFRQGPDRYVPGTKMPVQKVGDEASLEHLVDYLEQIVPAN
ncbi:MAG: hypothetical protein HN478_01675 [Rhodospirillaceae bacterium]|nr:hypothetical protein [Rhodospirillaceae bacterium]MBT5192603.1 hypothetical protein [Rhodospirillaceae bacterium]MBT5894300.1 hypothetical protein [Rhodospirillaceae bacterium]MBT6426311.1 hypothetical protein [Rhodospirillaceae bacterium]MBT7756429.1 hypothetical protein [Rhodospirillaceae bacterium]